MAFLDDLGKKISQAGQTAVQKTKDITDLARLSGLVSDEEKKINGYYLQVGKLYVAKHSSDYESDFADIIAAIKESESKISDYRQQIQNIKGVVRCPSCGGEVAASAAFCSSCGATVKAAAPADTVNCPSCGAAVKKGTKFCTACGKPMEAAVPAAEVPQPVERKCPSCNASVNEDSVFCTECGTKLS